MNGILRGKYMSREKFFPALEGGFSFCDVVLGWVSNDQLYGNMRVTDRHKGYPDASVRIFSDTYREVPWRKGMLLFQGEIEGQYEETGPGMLEAGITVNTALNTADEAALFKNFTRIMAQKIGMLATFMAMWSPHWPGQSGHIHMFLKHMIDGAVFYDKDSDGATSPAMRRFVGGQQNLMLEMLAMIASTINSYACLIPGFWKPMDTIWASVIEPSPCG